MIYRAAPDDQEIDMQCNCIEEIEAKIILEHMRVTGWIVKRDFDKERLMCERVEAAREYLAEAIREFDETHKELEAA